MLVTHPRACDDTDPPCVTQTVTVRAVRAAMAQPLRLVLRGRCGAWGGGPGITCPFSLGAKAIGFTAPAPRSLQQVLPPAANAATISGQ